MGSFSITHWIIVLVIVLVIFGTKKIRNIGSDLGSAVKGFKDGMKGESEEHAKLEANKNSNRTIDVDVKETKH